MRKLTGFILAALLSVGVVGCSGDAPKDGDNPAASNAVSSSDAPNASKRGAPMGAPGVRQQSSVQASVPAARKGQ